MKFREFVYKDLEQLIDLIKGSFPKISFNIEKCKDKLDKLLKGNKYKIFIAKTNKTIVACIIAYLHTDPFDDDFATLWYLAVKEEYQNQNLGTKIYNYALNYIKNLNIKYVYSTTSIDNIKSQRIAEKNGMIKGFSFKCIYNE